MSRKVAVAWHASFSIAAGVLYFFFILPRWPELRGTTSFTLGTVLRIVAGALIGLAALPVVFTLLRTRKPELGTPQLALTLRTSSIALHVFAGVLIVGTAISEIWLDLDTAGRWLFGIYGGAAAIALLGMFAFYLAYVAELPPPPPKPVKPKSQKKQRRRGRKKAEETAEAEKATGDAEATDAEADDAEDTGAEDTEAHEQPDEQPTEVKAEDKVEEAEKADEPDEDQKADDKADEAAKTEKAKADEKTDETAEEQVNGAEAGNGTLRNRRTSGRITLRRRKRSRGGVAVDD
ncbi:hypothetical protein CQY20_11310 [Mycolicibacterium agri]|uniref:Transmembrane protein n=1 Tax=Mycolicibacterium agri TaxID=36811 RepID=A0A2A7N5K0_MYCAG|nr:hypothetical protein [Mycolicibacterium agri]PEG39130.1 hypothetical protein CQY20_11310 [Mycolicibacterium agri]GFG53940.1 hypothetical protein MAGR_53810 [Mycolicibacterium agri]